METSIIIPVYNVQDYIENTLRSILDNSYEDYELIIIDDGSTDCTSQIVRRLQHQDSRISIFYQEHQGVSAARNRGLDMATGEFVAFIDGDDLVALSYFSEMVAYIRDNNLDWVMCAQQYYNIDKDEKTWIRKLFKTDILLHGEKVRTTIFDTIIAGSEKGMNNLTNVLGLYRKDIIARNMLRFDEKIVYGEDMLFNLSMSKSITGFGYISSPLYTVIMHHDSSSAKMTKGGRKKAIKPLIVEVDRIITSTKGEWSKRDLNFFWNRMVDALKNDVLAYKDPTLRHQAYDEYKETFLNDDLIRRLFKRVGIGQAQSLKQYGLMLLIRMDSYSLLDFVVGDRYVDDD